MAASRAAAGKAAKTLGIDEQNKRVETFQTLCAAHASELPCSRFGQL